jgi:catechol 2,3-dioxygenase-like lactoylglutathione lyase family enzyme
VRYHLPRRPPRGSKLAVRATVLATLHYAPQIRRRRQNSTGTFLVWRSSAGASTHPLGATAFLSTRPEEESHEIVLFADPAFAHVAFKVSSLAEFRSFHARVEEKNIPIKFAFNHRVSFSFYFDDPDGNIIEVYWPTGDLSQRQPHAEPLDLSQPDEVLLEERNPSSRRFAKQNSADRAASLTRG